MDRARRLFKPEFLNRIDEIIAFHQFTREHIKGVAGIVLDTISERYKEQLGVELEATDSAKEHLTDKGCDDKCGAKSLRRTMQNLAEDRMAEETLDSSIKAGSLMKVGFDEEKLAFIMKAKATRPKAASKPAAAREGSEDRGKIVRGRSNARRVTGRKEETRASKA